jgi:thiamine pyrophosphate-dependent acetolactate synthase large subunit-like protein
MTTTNPNQMNRLAALEVLKGLITDEIVVSSYSTASDWIEVIDRPLNYFFHGAMGLCSSHGLGLALAFPNRRVIVLDGDGSLLMNLSTLVTIAAVAPKNFMHCVFQNGTYEANGGHPIPNPTTDFEGIARSAGIVKSTTISTLQDFKARMPGLIKEPGPVFVSLQVEQGPLGPRSYKEMYRAERRAAFKTAVNA